MFWTRGYEATSLDDLCAATGLSRSSFYATFESKHALLLLAVDRYAELRAPAFAAALGGPRDIHDAIARVLGELIDQIVSGVGRRGCFLGNCAADADMRDALVALFVLHPDIETVPVETGTRGLEIAKPGRVDLVIMDVGLPDIDGREVVRILRKNGFNAPITMLSGQDTDSDTILGLEAGANDYVSKPFRFAVLLARIRARLRQHEANDDPAFTIGRFVFRPR